MVEVWDYHTGTLKHRLTGHAGTRPGIAVVYNTDGSRLFTRDAPGAGFGGDTAPLQIHVWDTTTGRELLTLTPATGAVAYENRVTFRGEKLLMEGLGSLVFDGTPVKP